MKFVRLVGFCVAFCFAAMAWGQQAQDELGLANLYATYRKTVFWVGGGFLLFLVGVFLLRRAQRKAFDQRLPFGFEDLSRLEQRGMLTREEAAKVREALIRQATQRTSATPRLPLKGEAALLNDEEVKRLEALAAAKRMEKEMGKNVPPPLTHESMEIPEELRPAVEKGLLSVEEAKAIARRSRGSS